MLEQIIKQIQAKYSENITLIYADNNYKPIIDGVSLILGTTQTFISLPLDKIPANLRIELEENKRVYTRKGLFYRFLKGLLND